MADYGGLESESRGVRKRKTALFVVVLLFASVVVFGFFFFREEKVSLSVSAVKSKVLLGENLVFDKELSAEKAVIALRHEVLDYSGKTVVAKQEKVAVRGRSKSKSEIALPKTLKPGRYTLSSYIKDKNIKDSFSFEIVESIAAETPEIPKVEDQKFAPVESGCPSSCDDGFACTEDVCENAVCISKPVSPCCGNRVCEGNEDEDNCALDCSRQRFDAGKSIEQAKNTVKSDPRRAENFCKSLPDASVSDNCFAEIAKEANQSRLCDFINEEYKKDNCLMDFALKNDFSVCEKVANQYLASSCYSLERLRKIEEAAKQNNGS